MSKIVSMPSNNAYRTNWDRIFSKDTAEPPEPETKKENRAGCGCGCSCGKSKTRGNLS